MGSTLGVAFRVTSFGESHGRCVGVVVDGCPAGLGLTEGDIQRELDRRRPGQSPVTTARAEEDRVEVLSGVFNGLTTGVPICMLVWNRAADSTEYERRRWTPRPGHADYTAHVRYGGFNDYRGGGRFSGRITAGYVMAGAVARKLLREALNVEILAHAREIGGISAGEATAEEIRCRAEGNPVRCADPEAAERMVAAISRATADGDSLGGVVECIALNMPAGVGEPVFDTLEGDLAKALLAIPAAKAVEFGLGRLFASLRGSESNDPFAADEGRVVTETNRAGGILGGISTGMPITCRVTFKPTPSIGKPQKTVDLATMRETVLETRGRHDPCVVPRAVPVVESMVAVVLCDHALRAGLIHKVLEGGI
ncbi:chorismate synthase [miscellaneous Crenarchaeota group-15 archaeon DG-45]|uniref:Chorismate synthase n=1 Tax=miscellaneous Crenarchaeota group-15 archaeon DG-45 TaxID=1685127 RepID=A0A0M0BT44_9ARCH|nr:MAG: chorismate synthase [miscellaneous Crenarchaeota group-15 archaeon DG-45]